MLRPLVAVAMLGGASGGCDTAAPTQPDPDAAPVVAESVPNVPPDPFLLSQQRGYLDDAAFRRAMLVASLTNPDNVYSRARLSAYGLGDRGWDALPVWVPITTAIDEARVQQLQAKAAPSLADAVPIWDGRRPEDLDGWVDLGRRVFFSYPLRPEVFAEHALAHPDVARRVGLQPAADGTWPGVVAFEDLDGSSRVGITCALCHVSIEDGSLVVGKARRDLDYGAMRLAYHEDTKVPIPAELAARMATWGPGRADITQDDDEDPVAIVDLWEVGKLSHLTQAGTLRHVGPAVLAIRQETQILHANRERTRPPRELAWALAMYVYTLKPPPTRAAPVTAQSRAGHELFSRHCSHCHTDPSGSGGLVSARRVGTDLALAFGHARGTGRYRPAPLIRVADAAPYLHHGAVATLEDLLDPARLEPDYERGTHGPGPVPGHRYGTQLPAEQRAALVAYLRRR